MSNDKVAATFHGAEPTNSVGDRFAEIRRVLSAGEPLSNAPLVADLLAEVDCLRAAFAKADRDETTALEERDHWQERLDNLIYALASVEDVGEWSSGNDPADRLIEYVTRTEKSLERERDEARAALARVTDDTRRESDIGIAVSMGVMRGLALGPDQTDAATENGYDATFLADTIRKHVFDAIRAVAAGEQTEGGDPLSRMTKEEALNDLADALETEGDHRG